MPEFKLRSKIIKGLLIIVFLLSSAMMYGQSLFAIVTDRESYRQAKKEINAYAETIEQINGLKTIILIDRYGVPDSLRNELYRLYCRKKQPLVGAVFVGDIPIPMLRDAQHLTSAFKMNQRMDRRESSVPSDRFYDDFNLQFSFEGQDPDRPYFYYSLKGASSQRVHSNIFTGRIRPTDSGNTSRYAKLKNYLLKVIKAKRSQEKLEDVFYFTGSGSLSNSKVAAMDEKATYYEHFPWLKERRQNSISYMDFSQKKFIKECLMNELMRPELDFAVLHHHGDWDTQYLNKQTADMKDSLTIDSLNLHVSDFSKYGFKPEARFIILDACFNGAFHKENCIANEYIFGRGRTIAVMGNTVNVLQDKWYDKYIGLLGTGMFAGYLNILQGYLESHLIGDPTFTFQPTIKAEHVNAMIACDRQHKYDDRALNRMLKSKVSDIRNLAMELSYNKGSRHPDGLLKIFRNSTSSIERLQALELLSRKRGDEFIAALTQAANDPNEMVQRLAVNFIRQSGDTRLIPALMNIIVAGNTSARVQFDAEQAVMFFPRQKLLEEFDKQFERMNYIHKDSVRRSIRAFIEKKADYWAPEVDKLFSDKLTDKQFNFIAGCLRLYCPHDKVADVIRFIETTDNAERKKQLIESLGWMYYSYNAPLIRNMAQRFAFDSSQPETVRNEALKTYNRLK